MNENGSSCPRISWSLKGGVALLCRFVAFSGSFTAIIGRGTGGGMRLEGQMDEWESQKRRIMNKTEID